MMSHETPQVSDTASVPATGEQQSPCLCLRWCRGAGGVCGEGGRGGGRGEEKGKRRGTGKRREKEENEGDEEVRESIVA